MRRIANNIVERCVSLRKGGASYAEISKAMHLSKATAYFYTKAVQLSPHAQSRLGKKVTDNYRHFVRNFSRLKRLNRRPRWGPVLARILSHCIFDGSITDSTVRYTNTSKALVDEFSVDVASSYGLEPTSLTAMDGSFAPKYTVDFCSKELSKRLRSYLPSQTAHSLFARAPVELFSSDACVVSEFLRAFWEDEGCVTIGGSILGRIMNKPLRDDLLKLHAMLDISVSPYNCADGAYGVMVNRNRDNIRAFQSVSFKDSVICRGLNKGMLKKDLFNKLFHSYLH
jgi:hypothetical protein